MKLIVGERYRSRFEKNLTAYGIESVWMPPNLMVDDRLACHVDLSLLIRDKIFIKSLGCSPLIVNYLSNNGYRCTPVQMTEGKQYPLDVRLCVCDTGRYLIYNPRTAASCVAELFADRIYVPVSQGYTKCAICVLDAESIITTDAGIAKQARLYGMEVLQVRNDSIRLPGFMNGFIGGASVNLGNGRIGFFGDLQTHPDYESIACFIHKKGLQILSLSSGPLFDVGSAAVLP